MSNTENIVDIKVWHCIMKVFFRFNLPLAQDFENKTECENKNA